MNNLKMLAYPRYCADAPRFVLDADARGYGFWVVLCEADITGVTEDNGFALVGFSR